MAQLSARFRWVCAPLPLLLIVALPDLAAGEPPGSGDESAEAVIQLPPAVAEAQQAKVLSAAARTAVNYVDAAALAVAAGDLAQGGRLLGQARQLLDQIQGGIRERAGIEPIAVVPVMARVRAAEGVEVSDALAARIQALEPQVLAGEHDRVLAALRDVGVSLTYDYVGMPLQATRDGIGRAETALAAGESGAALAALTQIVQGLEARTLSIGPKTPESKGQGAEAESR
jgi:hypothetical protein